MSILIEFTNSTLNKPISWDNVFKVIGFIGSAIAFLWTVASGLKTFKNAANDKRDKQISEYISLFADENRIKRISGVNGLVRHVNLTFNELFYVCATETDAFIQGLIHNALENICINKKADCVKNNKFLVQYCLKKNIVPLKMPEFTDKKMLLDILRRGNTETRIEIEINSGKRSLLYNDTAEIRNYAALSSQLLAKSLTKISNEHLKGVMFVDSSLYGAFWKKCRLENAALLHNIGRHAKGKKNIIGEVYLWDNDFYGSEFTEMDCYKIYSYNTHLRNSVFNRLSIRGTRYPSDKKSSTVNSKRSIFDNNVFSMSKFYSVKIEDCNMIKVEWQGCTLEDVSFASMMIKDNDWSGAKSVRCSFIHIGLYISTFCSEFLQCNFEDVKWGGGNLRGTKFKECTFKKVDFKGSDMKNASFEKSSTANLQRSVFEKNIFYMSKFYSVKIEGCNMIKAEWKGCTLEDVSFASMMIKENDWSDTKSVRCSFIHIGLYISTFCSEFLQCNFEDVKWEGSSLQGAKFKECTFKKVDFKEADMDNVLFENCTFVDGIDFTGAKNSDGIVIKEDKGGMQNRKKY